MTEPMTALDAPPQVLSYGDLTLDPLARIAAREGREIALTPRECTILEFLMEHPARALTNPQISYVLWGDDISDSTNAIRVYVGYLRRKLGPPQIIHTIRGIGYRLK